MTDSLNVRLGEAVELALGGDWQAAHLIAQDHEGNELANWIHAICHRMEGDLGNARYWYRRCGRELDESISTHDELFRCVLPLARSMVSMTRAKTHWW